MRKNQTCSPAVVVVLVVLMIVNSKVLAQIETTSYFMSSLPQYVINNPAFVPKYAFSLGLPGSSISATYSNNGFSYNDILKKEGGVKSADLNRWIKAMPKKTSIVTSVQADIFRWGASFSPKFNLMLSSTIKGYSVALFPKELASVFVNGNSPYVGQTLTLSPEVQMISYLENAVGFSFEATKKLRVGARLKYLAGGVSAKTELANLTITQSDNYSITAAADMKVKTSGLYQYNDNNATASDYFKNRGWGVDLGATYKLLDRLTLAASLIDIGQINWKNNTYEYSLDRTTARYTFEGIHADQLFNGDAKYLDGLSDSIQKHFDVQENKTGAFKTALPTKTYLSGSFEITKRFHAGAILFAEKFYGHFRPGFALAMNKNFGKVLSTSLSYTVSNRSFNNFGAGLSLNLAPLQIYIVGDNLLSAPVALIASGKINPYLNGTQVFTLRTGLNFVFGWNDKDTENVETTNYTSSPRNKRERRSDPDYINLRKKK